MICRRTASSINHSHAVVLRSHASRTGLLAIGFPSGLGTFAGAGDLLGLGHAAVGLSRTLGAILLTQAGRTDQGDIRVLGTLRHGQFCHGPIVSLQREKLVRSILKRGQITQLTPMLAQCKNRLRQSGQRGKERRVCPVGEKVA